MEERGVFATVTSSFDSNQQGGHHGGIVLKSTSQNFLQGGGSVEISVMNSLGV